MRKALGYARVSTDKQAERGVSLEDQETRVRARAISDGVELVDFVIDDGYTASNLDRPGIQLVLEMVKKRQFDTIIVTKLDRLTRSITDFQSMLASFEKHGVSLVSMGESVDTSCAVGRMVLNVIMSVLQWHREEIAEKTATAMRHKKSRGEKTGGKVPYGFDVVEEGFRADGVTPIKKLVRNEDEQAVIQNIRRLRSQGESLQQIADWLNDLGFRTRDGGDWKRQYIHRIVGREK